jgi:hypothetical protein
MQALIETSSENGMKREENGIENRMRIGVSRAVGIEAGTEVRMVMRIKVRISVRVGVGM